MDHILLVEDDENIANIVKYHLQKEGYGVTVAADGRDGWRQFQEIAPSLILLDIMLPGMNGLQLLEKIRAQSDVPVIITSARMSEQDRLEGLARMADDYIVKPFSVKELLARVKVLLARYQHKMTAGGTVQIGPLEIDTAQNKVTRDGVLLTLSQNESDLLRYLAAKRGSVCTRAQILQNVWGYDDGSYRTVDVAVRRLREKTEEDPARPQIIKTSRGQGYYCV